MIILGVDSSSKTASAAVVKDGKVLSETFINNGLTHSQTLMKLIDVAVKNAKINVKDIDLVAVTNGPGSFTGVRIGLACVKGISFTEDVKCCPVSTLEALAVNVLSFTGKIYSVLDARCSQVYFAEFYVDGKSFNRLCDDCALTLDEVKKRALNEKEKVILVGDGAELCYNYLKNECGNVYISDENNRFVRGGGVALLALQKENKISSFDLNPNYLRLPQAQRNLKKENV